MSQKTKTVIVEEKEDDVLFHPRVVAKAVDDLKTATALGFREIKDEIHAQRADYATNNALVEAKREAELQHKLLQEEIKGVRSETHKNSRVITWVGRLVMSIVIASVLAVVGYTATAGGHH